MGWVILSLFMLYLYFNTIRLVYWIAKSGGSIIKPNFRKAFDFLQIKGGGYIDPKNKIYYGSNVIAYYIMLFGHILTIILLLKFIF